MTAIPNLRAADRPAAAPERSGLGPVYRGAAIGVALLALAVFPLVFTNQQVATIAFDTLIATTAASAWNLFSGYSGYISLGHAVFFGSGAYGAGLIAQDFNVTGGGELLLLIPAGLIAGLIAVPFGLVALRVRRHTFVVITIAIFFIFQLMAYNFWFTHGTIGLNAPYLLWNPVTFDTRFYYVALVVAIVTVGLAWMVRGSRFGLQLRAIRDDEDRARGLGVRATPVKLTALVISATLTGVAGALWFFFIAQVQPNTGFDPNLDLMWALMAFLGGLGTVAGPVVGSLIVGPANQYLTSTFSSTWAAQVIFGSVFLAVVLLLPRGLLPTISSRYKSWRAKRTSVFEADPAAAEQDQAASRKAAGKHREVSR